MNRSYSLVTIRRSTGWAVLIHGGALAGETDGYRHKGDQRAPFNGLSSLKEQTFISREPHTKHLCSRVYSVTHFSRKVILFLFYVGKNNQPMQSLEADRGV